jgi:hypothetical protein
MPSAKRLKYETFALLLQVPVRNNRHCLQLAVFSTGVSAPGVLSALPPAAPWQWAVMFRRAMCNFQRDHPAPVSSQAGGSLLFASRGTRLRSRLCRQKTRGPDCGSRRSGSPGGSEKPPENPRRKGVRKSLKRGGATSLRIHLIGKPALWPYIRACQPTSGVSVIADTITAW